MVDPSREETAKFLFEVISMNDNDEVVVFCSATTAISLMRDDEEIKESLVISPLIPDTDAIVVKKQEFLEWLYEKNQ